MFAALPTLPVLRKMIGQAFKSRRVIRFEPLTGGLINTNLRVYLDNSESVVLRIYRDGSTACRKEMALYELVKGTVPVASLIHAEPAGLDGGSAFAILEYVDGITFQELKCVHDRQAVAEAASSVGKTLASAGHHDFTKPGEILVDSGQLEIGDRFVEGADGLSRLVDSFLTSSNLQGRIDPIFVFELRELFDEWSPRLSDFVDDSSLVHCDFGNRNILVRNNGGSWQVAAVLDWELAISGSPLLDVGNFLRYDYETPLREPYFSNAFIENGGTLPDDWHDVVRVFDLAGLVECLTHEQLPTEVESEINQLIRASLKHLRDQ